MISVLKAFFILLAGFAVPMARRIAIALGFGGVAYLGVGALLDSLIAQVTSSYSGLGSSALSILNMGGVNVYISLLISALVVRVTMMGLNSLTGIMYSGRWSPHSGL